MRASRVGAVGSATSPGPSSAFSAETAARDASAKNWYAVFARFGSCGGGGGGFGRGFARLAFGLPPSPSAALCFFCASFASFSASRARFAASLSASFSSFAAFRSARASSRAAFAASRAASGVRA